MIDIVTPLFYAANTLLLDKETSAEVLRKRELAREWNNPGQFSLKFQLCILKFTSVLATLLHLVVAFSFDSRHLHASLTLPSLSTISLLLLLRHALKHLARYSSSCLPGTQETSVFVFSASSRLESLLRLRCPCGFWRKIALFVIKTVLTLAATRTRAADAS